MPIPIEGGRDDLHRRWFHEAPCPPRMRFDVGELDKTATRRMASEKNLLWRLLQELSTRSRKTFKPLSRCHLVLCWDHCISLYRRIMKLEYCTHTIDGRTGLITTWNTELLRFSTGSAWYCHRISRRKFRSYSTPYTVVILGTWNRTDWTWNQMGDAAESGGK